MFAKTCAKCDKKADVEIAGQFLCTGHAFDKVMESKGPVPQLRRLK